MEKKDREALVPTIIALVRSGKLKFKCGLFATFFAKLPGLSICLRTEGYGATDLIICKVGKRPEEKHERIYEESGLYLDELIAVVKKSARFRTTEGDPRKALRLIKKGVSGKR